jgi:isoamyl acetate esterase
MQVGAAAGVPVVDLWTQLQTREWHSLLSDGLHLSEDGNAVVFHELQRVLQEQLEDILPDALPLDLPLHGDLDGSSASSVLAAYLA